MAFRKRNRRRPSSAHTPWPGEFASDILHLCSRIILWAIIVGVVGAGLLYLRLAKGPLHLPVAASVAVQMFNEGTDRLQAELGDLVLTLGAPGAPAGIQFIDLQVSNADGEKLFTVSRLAAKFDIRYLLRGELRPTRIVVIGPQARMLRTREGKFRFGLGAEPAENLTAPPEVVGETPQMAAILAVLDSLVGDSKPAPELEQLREIIISNADLTFENQETGGRWRSPRTYFQVVRVESGLRASLSVSLAGGAEPGARMVVNAERYKGSGGATRVSMSFDRLRPEHLAEQLDQMQWLRLFDAPLSGTIGATIQDDGKIDGLAGRISAGPGQILALHDSGQPFESVDLAFAYESGLERMRISELTLESAALNTQLSGFVDLTRNADDEMSGLSAQFEIAELRARVPDVLAEELEFDGGQIVARLDLDPLRIEVTNAHLRSGDFVVDVSGEARAGATGWRTNLRAAGQNLTVAQLVKHWPLIAAKNARRWVEKNIVTGLIDDFVAQMQVGDGKPKASMDFAFSGLESSYLKKMTPIRDARGRGSMTQNTLDLVLDEGQITTIEGAPIELGGSTMRIPDLRIEHAPAKVTIRGAGPTGSILTLIDEPPLGLMKKLGLAPTSLKGNSTVVVDLAFPLITTLKLDQVEVEANARLYKLKMPFRLPGGQVLDVVGDGIALRTTKRDLSISGDVLIDGAPMVLGWSEEFGKGSNHRTIDLNGKATPEMLARFGLANPYFVDGNLLMDLHLEQTGRPEFAFEVTADLDPARLEVEEFDWTKAPGAKGQLEAAGEYGDGVRVSRFRLDTRELKATGAVDFAKTGEVMAANIERVRFREFADVAVLATLIEPATGEYSLKVTGNRLDLEMFGNIVQTAGEEKSGPATTSVIPLQVEFTLSELVVTPSIIARPGSGTYVRNSAGDATARLEGVLAGQVPFTAEYERTNGAPGEITVKSDDAGALLKAAGLFEGANGGKLKLKAKIAPESGVGLVGIARIKDVRISGASTFKSILDEGGVKEAAGAAEGSGLAFDKVRVPFEYRDGLLILGGSTAKGPLLAVKIEGTVDETNDQIDLIGVISPAYALTGVLDSIPLIGDILSGGKGEGILAMTFRVEGSLDNPDFTVNPLSILAPGILRKLFAGRSENPDEKFLDTITREDN